MRGLYEFWSFHSLLKQRKRSVQTTHSLDCPDVLPSCDACLCTPVASMGSRNRTICHGHSKDHPLNLLLVDLSCASILCRDEHAGGKCHCSATMKLIEIVHINYALYIIIMTVENITILHWHVFISMLN